MSNEVNEDQTEIEDKRPPDGQSTGSRGMVIAVAVVFGLLALLIGVEMADQAKSQ